jgi:hypothetical protein
MKATYCKGCFSLLIPGLSASARVAHGTGGRVSRVSCRVVSCRVRLTRHLPRRQASLSRHMPTLRQGKARHDPPAQAPIAHGPFASLVVE